MKPTEHRVWRPAPGGEGLYEVSDRAEVYSLRSGILLKPGWQTAGYSQVHFYLGSKVVHWLLHRLVATAFVENPGCLPEVNHIDGNKKNNRATNLEWCSRLSNVRHAVETGLHDPTKPRQPVIGTPIGGGAEVRFESMKAADIAFSKSGKHGGAVSLCVKGKMPHAYGYVWRRE